MRNVIELSEQDVIEAVTNWLHEEGYEVDGALEIERDEADDEPGWFMHPLFGMPMPTRRRARRSGMRVVGKIIDYSDTLRDAVLEAIPRLAYGVEPPIERASVDAIAKIAEVRPITTKRILDRLVRAKGDHDRVETWRADEGDRYFRVDWPATLDAVEAALTRKGVNVHDVANKTGLGYSMTSRVLPELAKAGRAVFGGTGWRKP